VYVWGKPYSLEIAETSGYSKITIENENGCMKMRIRRNSPGSKIREVLDRWYRRILKKASDPLIKKWEAVLGVEVKKLYIRKMKTHWGSCNRTRQSLRLNTELARRSPECLEYVILHEMIHILVKGHNKEFYGILDKYCPGWKNIRKKMNSETGKF